MFQFTVIITLIAVLWTSLCGVDARIINFARAADVTMGAIVQRDVVNPPITYPKTGTVWTIGETHNVTWDTSVIPSGFKANGMIVLGFLDPADGANEHLDLDHPLAQGFPIASGRVEITVPNVQTRQTYILDLFGDSGNVSGQFAIKNISISAPPSSSTTTSTPTGSSGAASVTPSNSQDSSAGDATQSSADQATPAIGTIAAVPSGTAPAVQGSALQSITPGALTTQTPDVAESATAAASKPTAANSALGRSTVAGWMSVACVLTVTVTLSLSL